MIKAVVFDFGGVVVSEGFQDWISSNIAPYEKIENEIIDLENKVDRGDLPVSAYNEELAKRSNKTPDEVQNEILNGYILHTDVMDIVLMLKKNNVKTAILSNFPKAWFDVLRERYHLNALFDTILVSSEMHLIKPEKEIFERLLTTLSLQSDEVIFIDDKKRFTDAAAQLGIHSVTFTNATDLKKALVKLGLWL